MISIIVTWNGRTGIEHSLSSILRAGADVGGEVIIVNFGGNLEQLCGELPHDRSSLRLISVAGTKSFNKSAAQNIGIANAVHPICFFCDCDIVLPVPGLKQIVSDGLDVEHEFRTIKNIRETELNTREARNIRSFGYTLRIRLQNDRMIEIVDSEEDIESGLRSSPGLLIAARRHIVEINGYNSSFLGWGWEDQDMICRLTLGLGLRRSSIGCLDHISHNETSRVVNYPAGLSRWETRDKMFRAALANYDYANFLGTLSTDVERYDWVACSS